MSSRIFSAIAVAIVSIAVAGCGGSGSSGTAGGSLAQAQQSFVSSCHKDKAGDAADLKLCQCAAAKLVSADHYTAQQLAALTASVNGGNSNHPQLIQALASCQQQ